MQSLAQELERQYPRENQGRRVSLTTVAEAALNARTRPVVSQAGAVLMTISALVLMIACANVANLLLARATGRHKEIAIRLAMGASRRRLIRQLLTESVLLSIAGGAGGLVMARWARDVLWALRPPTFNHAGFRLELDSQVLLFTAGISIATGVLFGLTPALRATRADLATDLKERASAPAGFRRIWHPRAVLVMAQVAFSLVALIGAGLFARSLQNAGQIDPGLRRRAPGHRGLQRDRPGLQRRTRQGVSSAGRREGGCRSRRDRRGLARDTPFRVASTRTVLLQGQDNSPAGQGRSTLDLRGVSGLLPDYGDSLAARPRFPGHGHQDHVPVWPWSTRPPRPRIGRGRTRSASTSVSPGRRAGRGDRHRQDGELSGHCRTAASHGVPLPGAILFPDRGALCADRREIRKR